MFWAWVLGPIGAILAVPLTLAVKELILESSDESRWLAVLMEPGGVKIEEAANESAAG
jgi:predicted PurR-regulated permease PerM